MLPSLSRPRDQRVRLVLLPFFAVVQHIAESLSVTPLPNVADAHLLRVPSRRAKAMIRVANTMNIDIDAVTMKSIATNSYVDAVVMNLGGTTTMVRNIRNDIMKKARGENKNIVAMMTGESQVDEYTDAMTAENETDEDVVAVIVAMAGMRSAVHIAAPDQG